MLGAVPQMPSSFDEAENQRLWHNTRAEIIDFLYTRQSHVTEDDIDQAMLALMGEPNTSSYKFKRVIKVMKPLDIIEMSKYRYVTSAEVSKLQNECRMIQKSQWSRIFP